MKYTWTVILWLIFSAFSTTLFGQITEWNLDFEKWDFENVGTNLQDTIIENHQAMIPSNWHPDPNNLSFGSGIGQTTDATEGDFAVTLSGFYQYQVMRIISGESAVKPGWAIDFKPYKFIGDYKAILLGNCDSLRTYIDIYLTTYNVLNNNRDTVGQASLVLNEVSSYEQFEMDIDYSDELLTPDTVIVVLAKERFGFDVPPACLECSHVFFDNLRLTNTVSIQNPYHLNNRIIIFPNPTNHNLFIKSECEDCLFNITFINSNGQIVKRYNSVKDEIKINTDYIVKGLYFVKIVENGSGKYIYEKIIIE